MLFSGHQFEREHQTAARRRMRFCPSAVAGAGERGEENRCRPLRWRQLFAFGHALKRSAHGQRVKFGGDFGSKLLGRGPAPLLTACAAFSPRYCARLASSCSTFSGSVQILRSYTALSRHDHVGQFPAPSAGQLVQLVDAPVDGVQILHTHVVHFSRQAEHHSDKSVLMESSRSARWLMVFLTCGLPS